MKKEDFVRLKTTWYNNPYILYQIIENLKYRETVFIGNGRAVIRNIKANAVRYLKMNFNRYHFLEQDFNLYSSLAHYPDMPSFSFNKMEKRKEMDEFNKNYLDYMKGYDFLVDIDEDDGDIIKARQSLLKILKYFKGMPYYVVFSGTKGFHIRIEWDDFPEDFKKMGFIDLIFMFKRFIENFKLINNLSNIDLGVYDLRRIAKCPYSVVHYPYQNDKIPLFIALPMSDDMIHNFNLKEYHIKTCVAKMSKFKNRGLLKRKGSSEAFGEFIKKYANVK